MGWNALCVLLLGVFWGAFASPALLGRGEAGVVTSRPLLGTPEKVCTWGPSYWCQNLTTAKGCGAVTHCIQTVWEHQVLPEDNDDICTICKNMVKQARDQLESNETQEELKEVFEGSCNLIPLKPIAQGCDKLVDDFIPELVESLASQMNPQVVCSVSGLCNNAEIDRMLAAAGKLTKIPLVQHGSAVSVVNRGEKSDCNQCSNTVQKMRRIVNSSDRDDLLNKFLGACGQLGSFSDGCSSVVITNFPEIRDNLEKALLTEDSCELLQYCAPGEAKDTRVNVDVIPVGEVGLVPVIGDDMTCQFCERMVIHLRDILVANTTEAEFKEVMEGLCKQSKKFKDQCLSIVSEYYEMFYNFLVNNLNGKEICSFAGLCPGPGLEHAPVWPLIPAEINVEEQLTGKDESESYRNPVVRISVSSDSAKVNVEDPATMQLPLERMAPHMLINVGSNKEICEFCEYFLHFVQTELASERSVDKVKAVVEGACARLPATISDQCKDFVDAYGNAFVAILVQEIDPSVVCPGLGFCPSSEDSSILLVGGDDNYGDKPGCPLCLLAVEQLEVLVKDNKTEESVKDALESLCTHLPKALKGECVNFVDAYSQQLVDMLIADFTPQEVCVYIKLCNANSASSNVVSGDILTNELPQYENEQLQNLKNDDTVCVMCEFALARIDAMLKNNSTEEEIKTVVHNICNHLPKSVSPQCNKFVDQYADLVITLLAQEIDPKKVCAEMHLCNKSSAKPDRVALALMQQLTSKNVEECAVCEGLVQGLDTLLADPGVEGKINDLLARACQFLPAKQYSRCRNLIKVYGPSIENIISEIPGGTHLLCGKIGLCVKSAPHSSTSVDLLGGRKCSWGPGYWCKSKKHAEACGPGPLLHCQERVWKAPSP